MWVKPSVMNSNDILALSFSGRQESKQVSRGNIDCLRGPFMKSSAVTTSVDAIWRSRKHCYFSNREGTRRSGSIKTIMAIFSLNVEQCLKPKQEMWEILTEGFSEWGVQWYPLVAHNNSKKHFFMMTFNMTCIHISLLTQFISLKYQVMLLILPWMMPVIKACSRAASRFISHPHSSGASLSVWLNFAPQCYEISKGT